VRWAKNKGDLAEVLMQRDNPGNLDTAIALLQEALEVSPQVVKILLTLNAD
jgi:hypothetical protein